MSPGAFPQHGWVGLALQSSNAKPGCLWGLCRALDNRSTRCPGHSLAALGGLAIDPSTQHSGDLLIYVQCSLQLDWALVELIVSLYMTLGLPLGV